MARATRWALGFAVILLYIGSAAATSYMVGGSNGWTFPPNGIATFFDDWAKQQVFYVNDSLFFDYKEGLHDVLQVSKADVASCRTSAPIKTYTRSNATVTLDSTGYYGFICGYPSHCVANMKIEITVLAVGSPIPAPVAPGPAIALPPPAGSPAGAVTGPTASPGTGSSGPMSGPASGPSQPTNDGSALQRMPALILATVIACCAALFL